MSIINSVLGKNVVIFHKNLVNIYGCKVGDNTTIGPFVEIQKDVKIGSMCKISSHSFICSGVTIEDNVFIGHGVIFINDRNPRATTKGILQNDQDWKLEKTIVKKGASIGSGTTIMCGITIGENSLVGAGSVVTKNVAPNSKVKGNPSIQF